MNVGALIRACRVPASVPPQSRGLWEIARVDRRALDIAKELQPKHAQYVGPFDSLTMLFRTTLATLNRGIGECVMEDSWRELSRHLPILVHGRGRILVTGLGLGCVVRGLLAKPDVEHLDVVEIDEHIAAMVWPEFEGNPRATLHLGDARSLPFEAFGTPKGGRLWQYAWHDVWSEDEELQVIHAQLILRYEPFVFRKQGAWNWPRVAKRVAPKAVLG